MVGPEAETYLGNLGRAYPALISTQNSWYEGNKTQDVKPVMDAALGNSIPYTTIPTWQQVVTTFAKQAVATYNGQGSVDDLLSQTQAAGRFSDADRSVGCRLRAGTPQPSQEGDAYGRAAR